MEKNKIWSLGYNSLRVNREKSIARMEAGDFRGEKLLSHRFAKDLKELVIWDTAFKRQVV